MLLVISSNFVIIVGTSNYIGREDTSLQTSPPVIPQTSTETVRMDQMYIFEFSAKEGDSIHYRVSVDEGGAVSVYLLPFEDLSNLRDGDEFRTFSEGTNEQTRDFRANVEIPEDNDYAIVVRPIDLSSSTVDVIVGSGIYSYIVTILGGYLEFALLAISIILITTGIAIYRLYRKSNRETESELEKWEYSVIGKRKRKIMIVKVSVQRTQKNLQ